MEARIIFSVAALAIAFAALSDSLIERKEVEALPLEAPAAGSWACTADVKLCPDGSAVGRVPPYCHFDECKEN